MKRLSLLLVALVAIVPARVHAQPCPPPESSNRLVIDHLRGRAYYGGKVRRSGEIIRVPPQKSFAVEVCGTNTAAYAYTMGLKDVASPEAENLKGFLAVAGPYAVDVLTAALPLGPVEQMLDDDAITLFNLKMQLGDREAILDALRQNEASISEAEARQKAAEARQAWQQKRGEVEGMLKGKLESTVAPVRAALETLDALIRYGQGDQMSLLQVEMTTAAAIGEMRASPADVEGVAARLQTALGAALQASTRPDGATRLVHHQLKAVGRLAATYDGLSRALPAYDQALRSVQADAAVQVALVELSGLAVAAAKATSGDATATLQETPLAGYGTLLASARTALAEAAATLKAARAVEATAVATVEARGTWRPAEPLRIKSDVGREITLSITSTADADRVRAAVLEPFTLTLTAQPDWKLRPAVGLALLAAPGAHYPSYGAVESGETSVARQTGQADRRFSYALQLSLTTPWTDWREQTGRALWFPVFSINPLSDVRAVGLGAGVTVSKIVTFGAGMLWTRHQALDGLGVGSVVTPERPFRTRDTFGAGQFYFSISVMGWPPFTQ